MDTIYLIGGIGVDEKVFENVCFKNYKKHIIKWAEPLHREPLKEYCKRLLSQIEIKNPILVGVSFGGIVANELAELINVKEVILISSVRSRKELPWSFRFIGKLNIYKVLPAQLLIKSIRTIRWCLSISDKLSINPLLTILSETNPIFMKWALNCIVKWQGKEMLKTFQIHGNKDRIFPMKFLRHPDIIIQNAGHFMILNHAQLISQHIEAIASS